MGFSWMHAHCPQARYVMKTDTDMFINTAAMMDYITQTEQGVPRMMGECYHKHAAVNRNESDKWYVSWDQYPDSSYPPYCCGCGYVITGTAAYDLADVIRWLPLFPIEDAFIGVAVTRLGYHVDITQDNEPGDGWTSQNRFATRYWFQYNQLDFCDRIRRGRTLTVHQAPYYRLVNLWRNCSYTGTSFL